jgi:hypothetical protein
VTCYTQPCKPCKLAYILHYLPQGDESSPRGRWGICASALPEVLTILHASIHLKNGCDSSLWPQAVEYAAHIYNNTPNNGICPAMRRHHLLEYHVWGCPLYVLDPKMQNGKKLPLWEPRSHRGVFMGLIRQNSSEVPRVLNLSTGSITTQ